MSPPPRTASCPEEIERTPEVTTYDVHAHCIPQGLIAELRRDTRRYGTEVVARDGLTALRFAGGATTRPIPEDLLDVDRRLAAMDATGIDVQLLSSWIDVTAYGLPADTAVHYTRAFNEALAATIADHPGRFLGLCNVPLQDPQRAAGELIRAVTEDGMVGAEIATTVDGRDLDDRELDPFWAQAAELGCPVLIHPFQPLGGRDVSRYLLSNLVGRAAESTIALGYLIFSGVMERFPELTVISVHGGGFAPWQAARWDRGYEAVPGKTAGSLSRKPSEWLHEIYYDTVLHDPRVVGYLIDWAGAEHVVLGSDYPFAMGDPTPVGTLEAVSPLADETRSAVLGGNVERLLTRVRR
jgi:aminocarboxymuconate-semialdehyde decarboxylase